MGEVLGRENGEKECYSSGVTRVGSHLCGKEEIEAVVLMGKEHTHTYFLFEKDVSFVIQSVLYIRIRIFERKALGSKEKLWVPRNLGITYSSYSIILTAGMFC